MAKTALSPVQSRLVDTIYELFREKMEWPTLVQVDGKLRREFNVIQALRSLPSGILRWEVQGLDGQMVALSRQGLLQCKKAGPDLADFMLFVRHCVKAYLASTGAPTVKAVELDFLSKPKDRGVMRALATYVSLSWTSISAGVEDWEMTLSIRIRDFEHVTTIEELFHTVDELEGKSSISELLHGGLANEGGEPSVVVKPNSAFIMMSMSPDDPRLVDAHQALKDVCAEFGINAIRVDDVQHQDQITERTIAAIRESEFLIADLTGERPSVYYEVGYAHGIQKKPILVRRKGTPLHFDLAVWNCPEYPHATGLKEILRTRLEAITGRPPHRNLTVPSP